MSDQRGEGVRERAGKIWICLLRETFRVCSGLFGAVWVISNTLIKFFSSIF